MKEGYWIVSKKVVEKADIVLEMLDARFANLTRVSKMENIANNKLIYVINKADLISQETRNKLEREYAKKKHILISSKYSQGIFNLIKLIKSSVKKDNLRVAVIGYPNTGKSTLINKLAKKGRVGISSESGFTKGMQYISGKAGIMLIDTPGIIPFESRDEIRSGLVSGISPTKLKDPDLVAMKLIDIFKKNNRAEFENKYGLDMDDDSYEILLEYGKKNNMLLKKGEIDERRAAISILEDWHKGKIKL